MVLRGGSQEKHYLVVLCGVQNGSQNYQPQAHRNNSTTRSVHFAMRRAKIEMEHRQLHPVAHASTKRIEGRTAHIGFLYYNGGCLIRP